MALAPHLKWGSGLNIFLTNIQIQTQEIFTDCKSDILVVTFMYELLTLPHVVGPRQVVHRFLVFIPGEDGEPTGRCEGRWAANVRPKIKRTLMHKRNTRCG